MDSIQKYRNAIGQFVIDVKLCATHPDVPYIYVNDDRISQISIRFLGQV